MKSVSLCQDRPVFHSKLPHHQVDLYLQKFESCSHFATVGTVNPARYLLNLFIGWLSVASTT